MSAPSMGFVGRLGRVLLAGWIVVVMGVALVRLYPSAVLYCTAGKAAPVVTLINQQLQGWFTGH